MSDIKTENFVFLKNKFCHRFRAHRSSRCHTASFSSKVKVELDISLLPHIRSRWYYVNSSPFSPPLWAEPKNTKATMSEVFTSGIDDHLSPNPSSYLYTIGSVLFLSLTQIFLSFPFSFVLSLLPLLPLSISCRNDNSTKIKILHFIFFYDNN